MSGEMGIGCDQSSVESWLVQPIMGVVVCGREVCLRLAASRRIMAPLYKSLID